MIAKLEETAEQNLPKDEVSVALRTAYSMDYRKSWEIVYRFVEEAASRMVPVNKFGVEREDVIQSTMKKIILTRNYNPERRAEPWLKTILKRAYADELKRGRAKKRDRARTVYLDERISPNTDNSQRDLIPDKTATNPAIIGETDLQGTLKIELGFLPSKILEVIERIYLRGETIRSIAESEGIPIGTVKSRLHYGLRTLKRSRLREFSRV